MKQVQSMCSRHDGLGGMLGLGDFSSFTCAAEPILGELDFLNPEDMFLQH